MGRTEGTPNRPAEHEEFSMSAAPPFQFPTEAIREHRVREGSLYADAEFAKVDTACWRSENTLGKNLATAREAAGYTQQMLANALGVSERSIRRYEGGDALPDAATLRVVAMITGVPTDWLLGLIGDDIRDLMDFYEFGTPTQRTSIMQLAKMVQGGIRPESAKMSERDEADFFAQSDERIERMRRRFDQ